MLLTTQSDLNNAKDLIGKFRNAKISQMTPELWRAKQVLDSTLHPDTGEVIPLPFRMSSYVLSNLVVTLGMLTPNMGTAGTLFWQIANQSLNVAVNTANANKSNPLSTTQLVTSYFLAVSGSCGVALGLNAIVPRLRGVSQNTKVVLERLVPFAAVVSAGLVNVGLMRSEELRKGITVFDSRTNEPIKVANPDETESRSKVAATYAVGETAASRVINASPIMAIPPLILVRLQRTGMLNSRMKETLVNLGLITVTSFLVLPFALAVFPQVKTVEVNKLETKFQGLKNSKGEEIKEVWFNRGM